MCVGDILDGINMFPGKNVAIAMFPYVSINGIVLFGGTTWMFK